MVQAEAKILTLDEFLRQPETKPASEYVDGKISQKHKPQGKHSRLQEELTFTINCQVKPTKIACAFPELRCTFGGRSTVPDISVFVWNRIPCDQNGEIANIFSLAPDWTIEILSPAQSHTKVVKNIVHCLRYGSEIGWLLDPDEKTVLVYYPQQEVAIFDQPEILLPVPSFVESLNLTVDNLFSMLLL
ncbi:MAG: Uma2 family endonuclease [Microcystaceae cyanobacterium]